jgi:subtilisin family serine protease
MAKLRRQHSRFVGRVELLEDRRMMSATSPTDPLAITHETDELPSIEQHVLGEPDFWIDNSNPTDLDAYFDEVEQMLASAHAQTGWNTIQHYGFTGLGQTVAVIDSGIAWDHFALGGGLGAGYRVVGGWDFTEENDANPYDDGPSGSHGTHVSGIIGGSGSNSGVAPGVDFVGLRVFNDSGQGFFSWVENALRWVYNNRNSFENPITTVNLSLGVSSWNAATIPNWANLEDEFAQLESAGIFIAVSAGNSFSTYNTPGLSYPAASPYVVPVMATTGTGSLASFSQRLGRAIAAPGQGINSTQPDYAGNGNGVADDYGVKSGTSMAAPYLAGAAVLVRQAMQAAGMTGINQDRIYDHMMATADTIFDSVTSQSYKRLNLGRAIDALMENAVATDDYGSTPSEAHNLGTLTSAASLTGAIETSGDVDCFRFTAASTGTISFTAAASGGMTPAWQVWGATAAPGAAGTLRFSVVAGQTYTIGLSSSTGTGSYSLASFFEPFTYTDWGTVGYTVQSDVMVAGERWFRVQASRAGLLTVHGAFNAAAGSVNVSLYNSGMQLVAGGTTQGGVTRADVTAAAGGVYFVRVSGTNSDVDLKFVNLVTHSGSSVTAVGTAGTDAFTFSAGAINILSVNGVAYGWANGAVTQFSIQAGGGWDSIVINGSAAAETVWLEATKATMASSTFLLSATDVEMKTANSGGGPDFAYLFDSSGNDAVASLPNQVTTTLAGGQTLQANNYARTKVWAMFGGVDTAAIYDGAGNDAYFGGAYRGVMMGSGFNNEVLGFDHINVHATAGGIDQATLYDSFGNDVLTAWHNRATMTGPGFSYEALGFERVKAWSVVGGNDAATLYDSPGNDHYFGSAFRGVMMGAGFNNDVEGFAHIVTHATAGGVDQSTLYDTAGNDTFSAWSNRATLAGANFGHEVRGFEKVTARAISGGADEVHVYGSTGIDSLVGNGQVATYGGLNFLYEMVGFDEVTAHGLLDSDAVDVDATDFIFSQVGA